MPTGFAEAERHRVLVQEEAREGRGLAISYPPVSRARRRTTNVSAEINQRRTGRRMPEMSTTWQRYCQYLVTDHDLGFSLDVSRVRFDDSDLAPLLPRMAKALVAMQTLKREPSPTRTRTGWSGTTG